MWQAPLAMHPVLEQDASPPATERQVGAVNSLGLQGGTYTTEQASLLLCARDLAEVVIGESPLTGWNYKEARLVLVNHALRVIDHAWLREWSASQSRRGGDDDPKRLPKGPERLAMTEWLRTMLQLGPDGIRWPVPE